MDTHNFNRIRYLAYPHANGFVESGDALVLAEKHENSTLFLLVDLESNQEKLIGKVSNRRHPSSIEDVVWFDVARKASVMVSIAEGAVWLFDLERCGNPRKLFSAPTGSVLLHSCSLSSDGRRVLVCIKFKNNDQEPWHVLEIDAQTLFTNQIVAHKWPINHVHYSPYDESWIGYCYNITDTCRPRVWGWHNNLAPEGKSLFDLDNRTEGRCGHERWLWHDDGGIVVVYGTNPGLEPGVWRFHTDGQPPSLIAPAIRDLHADISRDGKFVVTDSFGDSGSTGEVWNDNESVSDISLIRLSDGARWVLARTSFFSHPCHPHPVFSPDNKSIFYNDPNESSLSTRRIDISTTVKT